MKEIVIGEGLLKGLVQSHIEMGTARRVAEAQLKRVAEWGYVFCDGHPVQSRIPMRKHQCGVCWQALLDEVSKE